MVTQTEQGSVFRIRCQHMEELHLLLQGERGLSLRVHLKQIEPDLWHAVVPLAPGAYQCRFYGKVGPTFIFLGPQENNVSLANGWNRFTVPAASAPIRDDQSDDQGHRDATRISDTTDAAPCAAALPSAPSVHGVAPITCVWQSEKCSTGWSIRQRVVVNANAK